MTVGHHCWCIYTYIKKSRFDFYCLIASKMNLNQAGSCKGMKYDNHNKQNKRTRSDFAALQCCILFKATRLMSGGKSQSACIRIQPTIQYGREAHIHLTRRITVLILALIKCYCKYYENTDWIHKYQTMVCVISRPILINSLSNEAKMMRKICKYAAYLER